MLKKTVKLNKIIGILAIFSLVFLSAFICNSAKASETSLYFSDEHIDYKSKTLDISVMLTTDKDINASDSIIKFDQSTLEFVSASTSDSIFDLWVKYPRYSKKAEGVYFAALNTSGFSGDGQVLSLKFKIKNINNFYSNKLSFYKSKVLANDGYGTNVLERVVSKDFRKQSYIVSMAN